MRWNYLIFFLLLSFIDLVAQDFKTITYFTRDSLKLNLDLFLPLKKGNEKIPLLIYVHGGGFSEGIRSSGHEFCRNMSKHGYAAATISYTLYMKNKSFGCDGKLTEKLKAIQIAVNQLWQATLFFTKKCTKYQIDTSKIFIAGNSAGAETVLQAAFWDINKMNIYPKKLSKTFKYAGVISGSGALLDIDLITEKNMLPLLLSHGTCDALVPYATAAHHYCSKKSPGWMLMYGSQTIYDRIISLNESVNLFTFCGGSHSCHNYLFTDGQQKVLDFMEQVINGEKTQNQVIIKTGTACEKDLEFEFCK